MGGGGSKHRIKAAEDLQRVQAEFYARLEEERRLQELKEATFRRELAEAEQRRQEDEGRREAREAELRAENQEQVAAIEDRHQQMMKVCVFVVYCFLFRSQIILRRFGSKKGIDVKKCEFSWNENPSDINRRRMKPSMRRSDEDENGRRMRSEKRLNCKL